MRNHRFQDVPSRRVAKKEDSNTTSTTFFCDHEMTVWRQTCTFIACILNPGISSHRFVQWQMRGIWQRSLQMLIAGPSRFHISCNVLGTLNYADGFLVDFQGGRSADFPRGFSGMSKCLFSSWIFREVEVPIFLADFRGSRSADFPRGFSGRSKYRFS